MAKVLGITLSFALSSGGKCAVPFQVRCRVKSTGHYPIFAQIDQEDLFARIAVVRKWNTASAFSRVGFTSSFG